MSAGNIWKAPFKIFGATFFALISFLVLLFLFSLLFLGIGAGVGTFLGKRSALDLALSDGSDYRFVEGSEESENFLLSIPVTGVIMGRSDGDGQRPFAWRGITYGYDVWDDLTKAADVPEIKGVLLRMQTPGGTIFGSLAIHQGLRAFQEKTGKPVMAFVEGLSASGGVMAMVGADAIYADHGSSVGSIGVIGAMLTYFDQPVATDGGLLDSGITTRGGIETTVISAGKGKDLGNPFRRPTAEEIRNLQEGVDMEYMKFVQHVAENRNIDARLIREQMGAQIFDNTQAQSYGLIDGTLNWREAVAKLAEMAGVGASYQLVTPRENRGRGLPGWLFSRLTGRTDPPPAFPGIPRELCRLINRVPLAYFGNVPRLCTLCEQTGM